MIELENHPDEMVAQRVALPHREVVDSLPVEVDGARVGNVEGSKEVQKRALPRSALSDDGEKLPFVNGQIDAAKDGDDVFPHDIAFVEIGNDHDFGAWVSLRFVRRTWERCGRRGDGNAARALRGWRRVEVGLGVLSLNRD